MPDALSTLLQQSLGRRSVREAAELCGLPPHRLRDIIYKRVKRPDEEVLRAIERGLGVEYERLALAAYGIIRDADPPHGGEDPASLEETPPADSTERKAWPPPRRLGTRLQRASAGIS